jgi:Fic family protein
MEKLQILSDHLLKQYIEQITESDLTAALKLLQSKPIFSNTDFEFYIQSSATYSSNIEGNSIDIDTYLKNKKFKIKSKPKEMTEIDDLVAAYNFANSNTITMKNFLETHKILSTHILSLKKQRGKFRDQQVGIFSNGKIEYMAVEADFVKAEMDKLFNDIKYLLAKNISYSEIFYFASAIHLIFEKIHPFMDGNGRAGRLLEKWFLASKLGEVAWAIKSEKYYAQNRPKYYQNIHIGFDYYSLKLDKMLPFLLMLPQSLLINED